MKRLLAVAFAVLMVTSMFAGSAAAAFAAPGTATAEATAPVAPDGATLDQEGTSTASNHGGVLDLNGRGFASVSDPGQGSALDTGGTFTIEFWLKYNASSDKNAVVLTKGGTPGGDDGNYMAYLMGTGDERRIRFKFDNFDETFTSDSGIPAGQWTHVAMTFDGSQRTLYVNGQVDAQESQSNSPGTNDASLIIGANEAGTGNFLNGSVEDLRLWQTSRSLFEIEGNYLSELSGSKTGLAGLWQFDGSLSDGVGSNDLSTSGDARLSTTREANPLPPLLHASPQDQQVVLNWSNRYKASDPNKYVIKRDGNRIDTVSGSRNSYVDTGVANGQTYTYTIQAQNSDGNLGGKSKAVRERPYDSRGGGSLNLDGRGYASATDRESLDLGEDGTKFTIEFWVRYNASSDKNAVILTKGGTPGGPDGNYMAYLMGTGEDRRIRFKFDNFDETFTSESGIQAGVWTHVTMTWDGSTRSLYINGELDNSESQSNSPGTNDAELVVGSNRAKTGNFLNGSVDDLRIWKTSRGQSAVEDNWYQRLTGDESSLTNYWRFNEVGETSATQSSATSHGELQLNGDAEIQAGGAYPVTPSVFVTSGNGNATVYWENRTVQSVDDTVLFTETFGSTGRVGATKRFLSPEQLDDGQRVRARNDATTEFRLVTIVDGQRSDFSRAATATPYNESGGSALSLSGGAYATVSDREALRLGEDDQPFTIEFWVKYEASSDSDAVVLSKGGVPGGDDGNYMAYLVGSGEDRRVRFIFNQFNEQLTSDSGIAAGVWTHVALTWDGSTRTIYINGKQDAQESVSDSPSAGNDDPLRIGADQPATGHKLEGQVDEVRLWQTARSDTEIAADYRGQLIGNETGLSLYWRFDDAGASTAIGSDAEHPTVLLNNTASLAAPGVFPVPPRVFARGENGNATVTYKDRANARDVNIYRSTRRDRSDRRVVATLRAGQQGVALDTGLNNGATRYYEATVTDDLGRESDFAFPAGALPSGQPAGNAFEFSGSNSYLTVEDRESLRLGEDGQTFTIEFWVKFNGNADEDAVILSKGGTPDGDDGNYMAYLEGTGNQRPVRFIFNQFNGQLTSNTEIQAGVWTHVALTWDGSDRTLYINGEKDAQESVSDSPDASTDQPLRIGADKPATGHFFQGEIDEVRLWQTARTDQQIDQSYDRELIGDEPGLSAYWRGCQTGQSDFTWGQARRPMTASFTNMNCVDSTIGLQSGGNVVSRLNVTIDGAPNGLRVYSIRVETTAATVIRSIEPALIDGNEFSISAGGAGSTNVTAGALDLSGSVGSFSGKRTLFTIEYSGQVTPSDVTVTVKALKDDSRNPISASRIGVENATAPTPTAPDLSGDGNPATDPDNDGDFEDINGDKSFNILDVSLFLSVFNQAKVQNNAALFDFTGDGTVNILDVSDLLAQT